MFDISAGVDALAQSSAAGLQALAPLQAGGLFGGPLGKVLAFLVLAALVVVVGRVVLRIAWRLVTIGIAIVVLLMLASIFLGIP